MTSGNNDTVERKILAYLDGDLDTAEADSVRRLIDTDSEARAIYQTYRKLYDDLHAAAPPTPAIGSGIYPEIVDAIDGAEDLGFADYDTFYSDTYRCISDEFRAGEAEDFDSRLADSPVHAEAFEAIKAAVHDLERAGDDYRKHSPKIDITADVMAAIQPASESVPQNVVHFPTRKLWATGIAVAAGLLIAFGLYSVFTVDAPETQPIATNTTLAPEPPQETPIPDDTRSLTEMQEALAAALMRADNGQQQLPRVGFFGQAVDEEAEKDRDSDDAVTEMVALRRVTFDPTADPEDQSNALQKLLRFAAIGEKSARSIANDPDASPRIRAAVAKFLPTDEARATLYAAIAQSPDDPFLRFSLAVHDIEEQIENPSPENDAAAVEAALDFASTAPGNATAYMLEARARLAAGDGQGALDALAQVRDSAYATNYALEAANLHAEAMSLIDGDTDESTVAAAMTAGVDEYGMVSDMAGEILLASEATLANGDADTARMMSESVYEYGQLLEDSALFSFEQLAIVDLEQSVLGIFNTFRDFMLPDTESLEVWTAEAESVTSGTDVLSQMFNQLDATFMALTDTDRIVAMAHEILGVGDLVAASQADTQQ